jgi:hypothetical protein
MTIRFRATLCDIPTFARSVSQLSSLTDRLGKLSRKTGQTSLVASDTSVGALYHHSTESWNRSMVVKSLKQPRLNLET